MQQRPDSTNLALVAALIGGGLLLMFLLLNRGSGEGLVGPTWQLAAITGETPDFQGVVPPEDQARYTITFGDDGTFAARADCNALAGTFETTVEAWRESGTSWMRVRSIFNSLKGNRQSSVSEE